MAAQAAPFNLTICQFVIISAPGLSAGKARQGLLRLPDCRRSRAPTSSASDWPREVLEPVNSILEDGVNGLASRNYGSDRGNRSKCGKKDDEQNYSIFHRAHLAYDGWNLNSE
jgi:hypothetical protein